MIELKVDMVVVEQPHILQREDALTTMIQKLKQHHEGAVGSEHGQQKQINGNL